MSERALAWLEAARSPEVAAAIEAIYDAVADEVRERRPICIASGQCCHFERAGHRLYVTGLEAALTISGRRDAGQPLARSAIDRARAEGTCPFLRDDRLCGAHECRPLGCRIYFCDRSTGPWQEALYERMHRAIAEVHERLGLPYGYGEWRQILADVVQAIR